MYKLKLDYLRSTHVEQQCLAAVLTTDIKDTMAGTPVLVTIPTITERTITGNGKKLKLKGLHGRPRPRRPRDPAIGREERVEGARWDNGPWHGEDLVRAARVEVPREAMREEPVRGRGRIPYEAHPMEAGAVPAEPPEMPVNPMREELVEAVDPVDPVEVPGEDIEEPERPVAEVHREPEWGAMPEPGPPNAPRLANLNGTGIKSRLFKILSRQDKITALDLYKMDIDTVNEVLHSLNLSATVTTLFNPRNSSNNEYIARLSRTITTNELYFDGRRPLIFDKFSNVELKRLSDVHTKNEIRNFPDVVNAYLQKNRFLNYVFTGVARSNTKALTKDLRNIFGSLRDKYPTNLCVHSGNASLAGLRRLIDVVSVSFYKLEDVIPIFDFKRSSGVAVEVFLTSSCCDSGDITTDGTSHTTRFLFSESRENVITIDGETINRPFSKPVGGVLRDMYSLVNIESPNDVANKGKSLYNF